MSHSATPSRVPSRSSRLKNASTALIGLWFSFIWAGMAYESYFEEGMSGAVVLASLFSLMFLMAVVGISLDCWRGPTAVS